MNILIGLLLKHFSAKLIERMKQSATTTVATGTIAIGGVAIAAPTILAWIPPQYHGYVLIAIGAATFIARTRKEIMAAITQAKTEAGK